MTGAGATMRATCVAFLLALVVAGAAHGQHQQYQRADRAGAPPDVATYARLLYDLPEGHAPGGALRRGFVPGWGQIYNRQFYKLPFVYAGLAALGYGIYHYNNEYLLFRRAALFRQCQEGDPHCRPAWQSYEDAYRHVQRFPEQAIPATTLHTFRNDARRNRDLFFVGFALYYALTVLDAYVSAHLVHFDVSESLSLRLNLAPAGPSAAAAF